jgi:hypothetical protein
MNTLLLPPTEMTEKEKAEKAFDVVHLLEGLQVAVAKSIIGQSLALIDLCMFVGRNQVGRKDSHKQ